MVLDIDWSAINSTTNVCDDDLFGSGDDSGGGGGNGSAPGNGAGSGGDDDGMEWEDVGLPGPGGGGDGSVGGGGGRDNGSLSDDWRERMAARQRFWSTSHGFRLGRKLGEWDGPAGGGSTGAAEATEVEASATELRASGAVMADAPPETAAAAPYHAAGVVLPPSSSALPHSAAPALARSATPLPLLLPGAPRTDTAAGWGLRHVVAAGSAGLKSPSAPHHLTTTTAGPTIFSPASPVVGGSSTSGLRSPAGLLPRRNPDTTGANASGQPSPTAPHSAAAPPHATTAMKTPTPHGLKSPAAPSLATAASPAAAPPHTATSMQLSASASCAEAGLREATHPSRDPAGAAGGVSAALPMPAAPLSYIRRNLEQRGTGALAVAPEPAGPPPAADSDDDMVWEDFEEAEKAEGQVHAAPSPSAAAVSPPVGAATAASVVCRSSAASLIRDINRQSAARLEVGPSPGLAIAAANTAAAPAAAGSSSLVVGGTAPPSLGKLQPWLPEGDSGFGFVTSLLERKVASSAAASSTTAAEGPLAPLPSTLLSLSACTASASPGGAVPPASSLPPPPFAGGGGGKRRFPPSHNLPAWMVPEDMPPLPEPSDEDEEGFFGEEGGGAAAAAAPASAPDLQPDFFSYRDEEGLAEPASLSTEDRARPTVLLRPPRQLPPEPPPGHQAMVDLDAELLAATAEGDALRRDQVRTGPLPPGCHNRRAPSFPPALLPAHQAFPPIPVHINGVCEWGLPSAPPPSTQVRAARLADAPTAEMYSDCQELLRIFGLPFIVAPMEVRGGCTMCTTMPVKPLHFLISLFLPGTGITWHLPISRAATI